MATWVEETKNTTTYANEAKSGGGSSINIGNPIGLLISLTYAVASGGGGSTVWVEETKN